MTEFRIGSYIFNDKDFLESYKYVEGRGLIVKIKTMPQPILVSDKVLISQFYDWVNK